jgi:tRNA pseudouridine38-40 synthase
MASGSDITDAVRTVYSCSVTKDGDTVTVTVCGDGFLYNMVRIIVGTLISVSEGKLSPDEIPHVTAAKNRTLAGITMPPEGLFLHRVIYPEHCLRPDWEGRP